MDNNIVTNSIANLASDLTIESEKEFINFILNNSEHLNMEIIHQKSKYNKQICIKNGRLY